MIEMTDEVVELIKNFSKEDQDKILKRAWDACCDGEWLASLGICDCPYCTGRDLEFFCYLDPWNGKNEDLRKKIETTAVEGVIDTLDF